MLRSCACFALLILTFGCATKAPLTQIRFLEQQANQGDALAQLRLGSLYLTGQGVEVDEALAAELVRKSADQGQPDAQILLAELYREGKGVQKDPEQTLRWMTLAAEQGIPRAQHAAGMMLLYGRINIVRKNFRRTTRRDPYHLHLETRTIQRNSRRERWTQCSCSTGS